jgi:hypothetical protein
MCIEANPTLDPPVQLTFVRGSQGQDRAVLGGVAVGINYTPWFVSPWGVIPPMTANLGEIGVADSPVRVEIVGTETTPLFDGRQFTVVAKRQQRSPDARDQPREHRFDSRGAVVHMSAGTHVVEVRFPSPRRGPSA